MMLYAELLFALIYSVRRRVGSLYRAPAALLDQRARKEIVDNQGLLDKYCQLTIIQN